MWCWREGRRSVGRPVGGDSAEPTGSRLRQAVFSRASGEPSRGFRHTRVLREFELSATQHVCRSQNNQHESNYRAEFLQRYWDIPVSRIKRNTFRVTGHLFGQRFLGCLPARGRARSPVHQPRNVVQLRLRNRAQVHALGQELPQQAVGVFIAAMLPRRARVGPSRRPDSALRRASRSRPSHCRALGQTFAQELPNRSSPALHYADADIVSPSQHPT